MAGIKNMTGLWISPSNGVRKLNQLLAGRINFLRTRGRKIEGIAVDPTEPELVGRESNRFNYLLTG